MVEAGATMGRRNNALTFEMWLNRVDALTQRSFGVSVGEVRGSVPRWLLRNGYETGDPPGEFFDDSVAPALRKGCE